MKLNRTFICLDCDELFDEPSACPSCGAYNSVRLTRWIKSIDEKWRPLSQKCVDIQSERVTFPDKTDSLWLFNKVSELFKRFQK